jgi:hypothetical protein
MKVHFLELKVIKTINFLNISSNKKSLPFFWRPKIGPQINFRKKSTAQQNQMRVYVVGCSKKGEGKNYNK